MRIEVDQSGKIEQLNMDTVIAFSNGSQYAILISKNVKQQLFQLYKGKIKQLRYKLFCIGIYFCLKDYLHQCELITVCYEYIGNEHLIKSLFLSYARRDYPNLDVKAIRFGHIGKKSPAHAVAIDVFRGNRRPNRILSKEDIFTWLKK